MNSPGSTVKTNRRIMRFGENHNDRLHWLSHTAGLHDTMIIVSGDEIVNDLLRYQNSRVIDPRRHWKAHLFSTTTSMLAELERAPNLIQKNEYDIFVFDPPAVFTRLPEHRVQDWLSLMADPASKLTYVY